MAANYPNLQATSDWVDALAAAPHSALSGVKLFVQCVKGNLKVYFGGNTAPTGKNADDGYELPPGVGMSGTTTHLWIKGDAVVAIGAED